MTDTTKPPTRPSSSRPRPLGRDGASPRGGDKPRPRSAGDRDGAPHRDGKGSGKSDGRSRDEARRDPSSKTRGAEPAPAKDDARIAKVMARAGLCSRRDAEGWIAAGRVAVNGAVIDSPALNVTPGDRITVDGEPLPEREQTRLYMYHKPRGLVTTARDPEGRPTIFDHLPEGLPRVVSIGRLDINTEGLMLLTNDGGLARVLELPQTGWLRRYRVRANGAIDQAQLDQLKTGVTIDGVDYAGIEATLDRIQGANVWLTMGLREGKNREIKRVLESLGLAVTRLIRISFGPFQLAELMEGAVESVPTRVLREQLGPGLAAQAGVDLETREEPPATGRGRRDADAAPSGRASRSDPAAPRPHVGALRVAREEAEGEGRRRIERGATADRKGRAVAVERVIPVGAGSGRDGDSRNARRFAAQHQDGGERQKTRADAGRPARQGTGFAGKPRRDSFGDEGRAARAPRPTARTGAGDGAPRARTGTGRSERAGAADGAPPTRARSPRPDGFAAPPRRTAARPFDGEAREERRGGVGAKPFAARPRGERTAAPRADDFSAAPRRPRAAPGGADAPSRGRSDERGESRGENRGGFGAKPSFRDRPAAPADKARTGKPNGRPGGFSSERPATGRNKPATGRPGGARPPGARPSGARPTGDRPGGGGFKGGGGGKGGGGKGGSRPPRTRT